MDASFSLRSATVNLQNFLDSGNFLTDVDEYIRFLTDALHSAVYYKKTPNNKTPSTLSPFPSGGKKGKGSKDKSTVAPAIAKIVGISPSPSSPVNKTPKIKIRKRFSTRKRKGADLENEDSGNEGNPDESSGGRMPRGEKREARGEEDAEVGGPEILGEEGMEEAGEGFGTDGGIPADLGLMEEEVQPPSGDDKEEELVAQNEMTHEPLTNVNGDILIPLPFGGKMNLTKSDFNSTDPGKLAREILYQIYGNGDRELAFQNARPYSFMYKPTGKPFFRDKRCVDPKLWLGIIMMKKKVSGYCKEKFPTDSYDEECEVVRRARGSGKQFFWDAHAFTNINTEKGRRYNQQLAWVKMRREREGEGEEEEEIDAAY